MHPSRSILVALSSILLFWGCTQAPSSQPADLEPPPRLEARHGGTAAAPKQFGLYVLALSWAPNFCCTANGMNTEECQTLPGTFGATHLTLHGLWPNYTDAEAPDPHRNYPQFCGRFARCDVPRGAPLPVGCAVDPAAIPPDMKDYAPGYVSDGYFLANHEWSKHGGCTTLDPAAYFAAARRALLERGGDRGTPRVITENVGRRVALEDLQNAFGKPESVLLQCDRSCRLSQVGICLSHDAADQPTEPVACPANTTRSREDNSCVLQRCDRVLIQQSGDCGGR